METLIITQEYYDSHPECEKLGLKAGDPVPAQLSEEEMEDTEDHIITEENIQEFKDANPGVEVNVGDVFKVPKFPEQAEAEDIKKKVPIEEISIKKFYLGKEIIRDGNREVEGIPFHSITLTDGTSYDLSESDYASLVKLS